MKQTRINVMGVAILSLAALFWHFGLSVARDVFNFRIEFVKRCSQQKVVATALICTPVRAVLTLDSSLLPLPVFPKREVPPLAQGLQETPEETQNLSLQA